MFQACRNGGTSMRRSIGICIPVKAESKGSIEEIDHRTATSVVAFGLSKKGGITGEVDHKLTWFW